MLRSHTKRKVICHLVKCGLRHVINNIPICHICFDVLSWNTVLKTQCNCVIAITSFISFHKEMVCMSSCFRLFTTLPNALCHCHCTPPLPAHSTFPTFVLHSRHIILVVMGKWFAKFCANEKRFRPSLTDNHSSSHICAICKFAALDGIGLQMHWLESPDCVSAEPSLPGADDSDMTQLYSQQKLDYAIQRGNMWYVACCGNQAISAGGVATSDVLYNDCPNLARSRTCHLWIAMASTSATTTFPPSKVKRLQQQRSQQCCRILSHSSGPYARRCSPAKDYGVWKVKQLLCAAMEE